MIKSENIPAPDNTQKCGINKQPPLFYERNGSSKCLIIQNEIHKCKLYFFSIGMKN